MGQVQIIGGNFRDGEGNPISNGILVLELPRDAVTSQPSFICSGIPAAIPLDVYGNVSGVVVVWPTDQLTPSTLKYTAWVKNSSGAQVWGPHKEVILSTPVPFNLNAWTATS
jgi:hypothetical protein